MSINVIYIVAKFHIPELSMLYTLLLSFTFLNYHYLIFVSQPRHTNHSPTPREMTWNYWTTWSIRNQHVRQHRGKHLPGYLVLRSMIRRFSTTVVLIISNYHHLPRIIISAFIKTGTCHGLLAIIGTLRQSVSGTWFTDVALSCHQL